MPHGVGGEWPESKNTPASGLGDWMDMLTRVGNTTDGAALGEKIVLSCDISGFIVSI